VPTSARALVVDFSDLEFIDSSGVAMMFGLARRLGNRRQELRVVARSGKPVHRVLEIVEFERAASIHRTTRETEVEVEKTEDGRFRLVIAVDRIKEALKQIVAYLNDHLDASVL
jgi:hypothetical protein